MKIVYFSLIDLDVSDLISVLFLCVMVIISINNKLWQN